MIGYISLSFQITKIFTYIRIEIRMIIYYMYGLTATRRNTRNNTFSVSEMKKRQIGK